MKEKTLKDPGKGVCYGFSLNFIRKRETDFRFHDYA